MNLTKRVDYDCRCLESYFQKLFDLLEVGVAEEKAAPVKAEEADALESQASYHGFTHHIKPGMLINIYSVLDFWLAKLCRYHKENNKLDLEYTDIKGDGLAAFHKYLTRYAGLDLSAVEKSYHHLHNLRKIRNIFIHAGGYVKEGERKKYEGIPGISLSIPLCVTEKVKIEDSEIPVTKCNDSLIATIDDSFIWKSLEHAKKYLKAITLA